MPQRFSSRDLVGAGYTETYTAANGSQVTERLHKQVGPKPALGVAGRREEWGLQSPLARLPQDHCLYQGRVEGHPHSAASLSTCDGLRCVPSPSTEVN